MVIDKRLKVVDKQTEIPEVPFKQSLDSEAQEASPKDPAHLAGIWDSSGMGSLKLHSCFMSRNKLDELTKTIF